jgi:TP901 family phage tail tape measure protein
VRPVETGPAPTLGQRLIGAGEAALTAITGATGDNLTFFKNQAQQMGIGIEGGAAATLKAFELIGSAMPILLENKEALADVTKEAIALSQASGMSLPDAAKSATSALNQYGAAASEASRYVNVLAAGALAGAAPIEASTQALEAFGSVAKGFNVSIEESIALTQTLADKSIMGAEAGTALRNVLLKMQTVKALDDKALADLSRLGVNLDVVSNATLPMSARMKELGKITGDATAMMHVFGTENINAAAILLNGQSRFLYRRKIQYRRSALLCRRLSLLRPSTAQISRR